MTAQRARRGVLALAVLLAGCGYQFAGGGRQFDAGTRTIAIETLENETREIGVEKRLAMAIEREFVIRGPLKIGKPDESDLQLSGTVKTAEDRPVAFNRDDEVLIYQTVLALDLELRRRDTGKVIWQVRGMRVADDYESVASVVVTTSSDFRSNTLNPEDLGGFTDVQLAETRRRETLDRMIGTLARDVYDQIMEDF
jgi:lipopolysaccharide assembly LptE-like protein